jgi:DNA repair protein RadC
VEGLTKLQAEKCEALAQFVRTYTTAEFLEESVVLDSSQKMLDFCKNLFRDMADRERCFVVLLNSQNKYITHTQVSEGTTNEAPLYVREVAKVGLLNNANAVCLAHNHPGGALKFSSADVSSAQRLRDGLEAVGMKLLDSIICTQDGGAVSAAERGIL